MTIKIYPTAIEAYDETMQPIFNLKCFDECCSTLTISCVVEPSNWPEISQAITDALNLMHEAK